MTQVLVYCGGLGRVAFKERYVCTSQYLLKLLGDYCTNKVKPSTITVAFPCFDMSLLQEQLKNAPNKSKSLHVAYLFLE